MFGGIFCLVGFFKSLDHFERKYSFLRYIFKVGVEGELSKVSNIFSFFL